jgi:hypothetical protein
MPKMIEWYWNDDLSVEYPTLNYEDYEMVAILRRDPAYKLDIDSPWTADMSLPFRGESYVAMVE